MLVKLKVYFSFITILKHSSALLNRIFLLLFSQVKHGLNPDVCHFYVTCHSKFKFGGKAVVGLASLMYTQHVHPLDKQHSFPVKNYKCKFVFKDSTMNGNEANNNTQTLETANNNHAVIGHTYKRNREEDSEDERHYHAESEELAIASTRHKIAMQARPVLLSIHTL